MGLVHTRICKELKILGQILKRIHRMQEKHWRDGVDLTSSKIPKSARDIHATVTTYLPNSITIDELEKRINASLKGNKCLTVDNLFLPPLGLDKGFLPILSIECDFGSSPPTMRLCVGMIHYSRRGKPLVFAFRFETSHENSTHNYYHGQFTRNFEIAGNALNGLPAWLPEHIPSILVPAKTPIALVLCMLVSFYGNQFRPHISDLNIEKKYLEPFEWAPN